MKTLGLLLFGSPCTWSLLLLDDCPFVCLGCVGDSLALLFSFIICSMLLSETILVRAVMPENLLFYSFGPFCFSNMILELEVMLDVYCPMLFSKLFRVALFSPILVIVLFLKAFDMFLCLSLTRTGLSLMLSSVRLVLNACSLMSREVRLLLRVLLYCTVFSGASIWSVNMDELNSILDALF